MTTSLSRTFLDSIAIVSMMYRGLVIATLVALSTGSFSPRSVVKPHLGTTRAGSYRLPGEVIPQKYSIKLVPYFTEDSEKQFTFDGEVLITVEAALAANSITLHMWDISVLVPSVSVRVLPSGDHIPVTSMTTDPTRDFLILGVGETLSPGSLYEINIAYIGLLTNDTNGFYRSSYERDGETRWLATTHFEATKARRAFPCFDEPALKATFDISIARLPSMHALSNMPLLATSAPDPNVGGRQWDVFETTVRMSTYLVAFVVSDFEALEAGSYRVWANPNRVPDGQFALGISPTTMKAMEDFTGVAYVLPKTDQVAIPDFGPGAMENWGLVLYRESRLLTNGESVEEKVSIATTIAHEFGHLWFGDLVTMDWWKFTWLNEGFATYFEYYAADKVDASWELQYIHVVESQQVALLTDSKTETSHPLTNDVETRSEIDNMFDDISYDKGGSIVKMMNKYLGEDTFYKGIKRYLNDRKFQSAVADDLFSALQKQVDEDKALPSDLTIKLIMDTWTLQAGYPVLNVTRDYQAGTATIQQKHFFSETAPPSDNKWFVPISYTTQKELQFEDARPQVWLRPDVDNVSLSGLPGDDQWILLNIQEAGFFRVNYDKANWLLLIDTLNGPNYDQINKMNRAQIVDDSQALGIAKQLDLDTVMRVTSYLAQEVDYIPWVPAFRSLERYYQKMGASDVFPELQVFYVHLVKNLYDSVGFAPKHDERSLNKLARKQVVHWACLLGLQDCLDKSAQLLDTWMADPTHNRISGDLRPTVYCAAVRSSGERVWSFLWEQYLATDDKAEGNRILTALGCTTDTALLNRLMREAITEDSGLKHQHRYNAFSAVLNGRDASNADVALQFLFNNYAAIEDFFGEIESVGTIMHRIASKLKTKHQVELLRQFVSSNEARMSSAGTTASSGLRTAEENLVWLNSDGADVAHWLRRQ